MPQSITQLAQDYTKFFLKSNRSTFFARICTLLFISWRRERPKVERFENSASIFTMGYGLCTCVLSA